MKEKPIIFSGAMVKAIIEGRKTMTRRVVRPPKDYGVKYPYCDPWVMKPAVWWWDRMHEHAGVRQECPYGHPGDGLWVRETWKCEAMSHSTPTNGPEKAWYAIAYKADRGHGGWGKSVEFPEPADKAFQKNRGGWRPSIHMPRWASRITLEIVSVRVERLQNISEEDAVKEGQPASSANSPRVWFMTLWDSINGKGHWQYSDQGKIWHPPVTWGSNPWVWCIGFRRVK